jgi:hypothetical protein
MEQMNASDAPAFGITLKPGVPAQINIGSAYKGIRRKIALALEITRHQNDPNKFINDKELRQLFHPSSSSGIDHLITEIKRSYCISTGGKWSAIADRYGYDKEEDYTIETP